MIYPHQGVIDNDQIKPREVNLVIRLDILYMRLALYMIDPAQQAEARALQEIMLIAGHTPDLERIKTEIAKFS
jgi:hypothetical protein